jgi:hypothetical protein
LFSSPPANAEGELGCGRGAGGRASQVDGEGDRVDTRRQRLRTALIAAEAHATAPDLDDLVGLVLGPVAIAIPR